MLLRGRRSPRGWPLRLTVLLTLAVVACRADSPVGPTPQNDKPFYYHQGERIYLALDRTRMVVGGESPVEDARLAAAGLGVEIIDAGPLPGGLRHLALAHLQDEATAIALEKRLRASDRTTFVIPGFRSEGGGSPVLFLDRLDVQFRQGVSAQQIAALTARLNLTVISGPGPGSEFSMPYRFRYPPRAGTDFLKIAAAMARHPLVEWASPDKVGGMVLSQAPPRP